MNPLDLVPEGGIASLVLVALISVGGSFLVARFTGKSTVKAAEVSADEDSYIRANEITTSLISQLRTELDRAQKQIASLSAALAAEQTTSDGLRKQVMDLQETMLRMQTQINTLTRNQNAAPDVTGTA
jgi:predicted  nucleic acid-binding Zn-ribbon protein